MNWNEPFPSCFYQSIFIKTGKETKPWTTQVISHPFSIRHGCLNKTLLVEKWFWGCLNPLFNPLIFNQMSTITGHFQVSSYTSVTIHLHSMSEYTGKILAVFYQWIKYLLINFVQLFMSHTQKPNTSRVLSVLVKSEECYLSFVVQHNGIPFWFLVLWDILFISDFPTFHI